MIEKNTVKSQDTLIDCNEGKRSSETLLQAVEKCERLQKQLDIALDYLATYKQHGTGWVKAWALECEQNIEDLNNAEKD